MFEEFHDSTRIPRYDLVISLAVVIIDQEVSSRINNSDLILSKLLRIENEVVNVKSEVSKTQRQIVSIENKVDNLSKEVHQQIDNLKAQINNNHKDATTQVDDLAAMIQNNFYDKGEIDRKLAYILE